MCLLGNIKVNFPAGKEVVVARSNSVHYPLEGKGEEEVS